MGGTVEDYCGTCGYVIHGTHDPYKAYLKFCYGHPKDKQEEAQMSGESMSKAIEAVRRMVEQIEGSEACKATVTHVEITASHIPLVRWAGKEAVYDISIAWVEG